ncbi:Photosystem II 22 kDa protein 1, chloroplastic [Linum grandiflorum]
MAQTMLFSSGVNTRPVADFKIRSSVPLQRPNSSASRLLYNPLPSSPSSSSSLRAFALFKPRTKAAPKKAAPPPKPKVEDGIFGTSGGIGFTKQNELFVGRVAMIGFAASLLGEGITGKGILSQLNLETGIPIYEAEPLLLFFILFTLLGAIGALGDRGRFVDEDTTGLDKAVIAPGKGLRATLGLGDGGSLLPYLSSLFPCYQYILTFSSGSRMVHFTDSTHINVKIHWTTYKKYNKNL